MKLMLFSVMISGLVWGAPGDPNELGDGRLPEGVTPNTLVSTIKEIDVEQRLAGSGEVQECYKDNRYQRADSNGSGGQANDTARIQRVESCFNDKLKNRTPQQLQELAGKLGLQEYKLVESNNVKEITKYLSDRLYKAMTGVDRNLQGLERIRAESFRRRKMTDQKDFVDLYKTQLTKNTLLEISRFCIQDLRYTSPPSTNTDPTFFDHWRPVLKDGVRIRDVSQLNDNGYETPFGTLSTSREKQEAINQIAAGLNLGTSNQDFSPDSLKDFFNMCTQFIVPLCKEYEKEFESASTVTLDATTTKGKKGARACLVKERLRNLRNTIVSTDRIVEQFERDFASDRGKGISITGANFYDRGQSNRENSLDSLSNIASAEVYDGMNRNFSDQAERCEEDPALPECADFFVQNDIEKTKADISDQITLKKEAEIARVKQLRSQGRQGLEEYLRAQGYLAMVEDPTILASDAELEKELNKIFKAKRDALIAEIDTRLKRRQQTPAEGADPTAQVTAGINAAKEERVRLAQVVMFNNIITSRIEILKDNGNGETENIGRNVNALNTELRGQRAAQVDENLFENLREGSDENGGNTETFNSVGLGGFIDAILKGRQPGQ